MRNIIIYLASMFFLSACNDHHQKKTIIQNKQANATGYPEIAREMDVKTLINIIDTSNCMYSGGIGIEGKESMIFVAFKRLDQLASDSLWLQLSYSSNPVMRIYAYKALTFRNQALALNVKERLRHDTARLCWIANDMNLTCTISFFISNIE